LKLITQYLRYTLAINSNIFSSLSNKITQYAKSGGNW